MFTARYELTNKWGRRTDSRINNVCVKLTAVSYARLLLPAGLCPVHTDRVAQPPCLAHNVATPWRAATRECTSEDFMTGAHHCLYSEIFRDLTVHSRTGLPNFSASYCHPLESTIITYESTWLPNSRQNLTSS